MIPQEINHLDLIDITEYENSGVYFLCDGGKILYIGESGNVGSRIETHRREKLIKFTKIYQFPCEGNLRRVMEEILIRRFRPPHNKKVIKVVHRLEEAILNGLGVSSEDDKVIEEICKDLTSSVKETKVEKILKDPILRAKALRRFDNIKGYIQSEL